jgi:CheY-like chemotaxis protein
VQRHEGAIHVESQPGAPVFRFIYPSNKHSEESTPMKPVWIIDDDRSIRWVFEKALARENLPHRIFESAEAALRALDRETPGAVVSDIRMPGMSGLDFMERLKAANIRACRSSS